MYGESNEVEREVQLFELKSRNVRSAFAVTKAYSIHNVELACDPPYNGFAVCVLQSEIAALAVSDCVINRGHPGNE